MSPAESNDKVTKNIIVHLIALSASVCAVQRGEVHGDRPRSSVGAACRELPRQTSLPAEEPVQAAHVTQIPAAPDRHTVRLRPTGEELPVVTSQSAERFTRGVLVCPLTFRSDKLRWISALSRPHPEIDFSSAQGEIWFLVQMMLLLLLLFDIRHFLPEFLILGEVNRSKIHSETHTRVTVKHDEGKKCKIKYF